MNSNNLKKQFERLSNCLGNKISGKINFGFTIVELIVVVGIFSLIMAVALWNQKELSNNILITNLSYEIALAVRETQSYGIGVRTNVANPTSADFRKPFGFHVDLDNPKRWVLFQDKDEDSEFDVGEIYAIYTFQNQNGNEITALCLNHPVSVPCRRDPALGSSFITLNILFKRPNPEAFFKGDKGLGSGETAFPGPAYIVVNTPGRNNCRAIIVETTGQIRVESAASTNPACQNL